MSYIRDSFDGIVGRRKIETLHGVLCYAEEPLKGYCTCHKKVWHSCPNSSHYKRYLKYGHDQSADSNFVEDIKVSTPEKTLAQITAEKRKIQNRLDEQEKALKKPIAPVFGVIGIVSGFCGVAAFIVLPWMCGVGFLIVAALAVWFGIVMANTGPDVMDVKTIAGLKDKMIDLEAEYEDKTIQNWNEMQS